MRGFPIRFFANSLTMGLPLPWQALRDVGKRYGVPFRRRSGQLHRYLYLIGLPHPEAKGIKGRPTITTEEAGIRQSIYLPVHRVLEYTGSLFASSVEGPVRLMVSFRTRNEPDKILASNRGPGAGWREMDQAAVPASPSRRGGEVA